MKKILIITLLLSSILFGAGFTASNNEITTLNDTIGNLQNQDDTTLKANSTTLSTLANGNGLTGGWEDSNFRYIYKMIINSNDRLAIFIITKINNYDNNLVKALNMQDNIILLIDANAQTKLLWSGYALADTPTTGTSSIDITITDDKSEILGVTLVNQDWIRDIVTYTFKFSESMTGFDASDVNVSGGTKGTFSGSGDTYTLEVTPNKNSKTPIRVDVGANIALGDGGDNNKEATQAVQEVNTQKALITTWKTNFMHSSTDDITIKLGTFSGYDYSYNYNIDWGDGTSDMGVTEDITHVYDNPGIYTISITGDFPRISFGTMHNIPLYKLFSVEQWGTQEWKSMSSSFSGCYNFELNAIDRPDLSNVTNMSRAFFGARRFNGDIGNWDVSNVTSMISMFSDAERFNQNIDDWDVSNVTSMSGMFSGAGRFNQPLNSWDVSSATTMWVMFNGATLFNQDINNWDVSSVIDMRGMFQEANNFNQPLDNWDVSSVNTMEYMFKEAYSFNQSIDNWNVSNVQNMEKLFYNAKIFNQSLNNWNTSQVTNMGSMFLNAKAFNQNINSWDTSRVTNMNWMFSGATSFNQNINNWDVSYVTSMTGMFYGAISFNQPLNNWNVSSVTEMSNNSSYGMFYGATSFNQDINSWDISNVTDFKSMFKNAISFNQPLNNWNVSNIHDMGSMFRGATSFNQPLDNWNVSNVYYMSYMFERATSFSNQDLSAWDVSNVNSLRDFSTNWGEGNTEPIWND